MSAPTPKQREEREEVIAILRDVLNIGNEEPSTWCVIAADRILTRLRTHSPEEQEDGRGGYDRGYRDGYHDASVNLETEVVRPMKERRSPEEPVGWKYRYYHGNGHWSGWHMVTFDPREQLEAQGLEYKIIALAPIGQPLDGEVSGG